MSHPASPDPVPTSKPTPKWRIIFEVSTTLAMLALAASLVWQGRTRFFDSSPAEPRPVVAVPRDPLPIAGNPTLGKSTARVAIVEYSDFECPFCGVIARDTIPTLIREYVDTGKVLLVFKNFPLAMHARAPSAAAAAQCAGQQGKFWPMHDRLFVQPIKLTEDDLSASAKQVGLDLAGYESCRSGTASAKLVEADRVEAETLKLRSTPTFFFGTVEPDGRIRAADVLTGAKPIARFNAILDRLLEQ